MSIKNHQLPNVINHDLNMSTKLKITTITQHKMAPITIETERLLLKGITPSLIHELFTTKTKQELMFFFGFDKDGYLHIKSMHEKGMETHSISLFYFLLIDKQSNLPIGECGFHTWNLKHKRAELFYKLHKDSDKRKGYMTEAVKVVLEYGFTQLNLHRIAAMVANSNTPSVKLVSNNKFTFEGTMREDYNVNEINEDSECYSLLKTEWEQSKGSV